MVLSSCGLSRDPLRRLASPRYKESVEPLSQADGVSVRSNSIITREVLTADWGVGLFRLQLGGTWLALKRLVVPGPL